MKIGGDRMKNQTNFDGFPKAGVQFLRNLAKNNDKIWFNENKETFTKQLLQPAQAFVVDMGKKLEKIAPDIHADPRTDKSIFRVYRDTRFSADKSPYKTHLGIFFWEGDRPKMECPGFYFHLEPPNLLMGSGFYSFPKSILKTYRDSVVGKKSGPALIEVIKKVSKKGKIGGKHYKQTPRGFDSDHLNAEYLLYNGLHVMNETKIPDEVYSRDLVDYCFNWYKDTAPLHRWLVEMAK
jgi:uncharacterized protein (TIGR02453 family)